jgi:hypothetical protein
MSIRVTTKEEDLVGKGYREIGEEETPQEVQEKVEEILGAIERKFGFRPEAKVFSRKKVETGPTPPTASVTSVDTLQQVGLRVLEYINSHEDESAGEKTYSNHEDCATWALEDIRKILNG